MSREGGRNSQFVRDVEGVCQSLIEQGETEVQASTIAAQLDGYTTQRVSGILWANANDADLYSAMDVNVEILTTEDGPNVYRLSRDEVPPRG